MIFIFPVVSAIFLKKIGSAMHTVTQNSVSEGEVLVKAMPGKNGSGTFQLASLFERTSEMVFRHVVTKYPCLWRYSFSNNAKSMPLC
jgi:hypothetical protein